MRAGAAVTRIPGAQETTQRADPKGETVKLTQVEWRVQAQRFFELAKSALGHGLSEELVVKLTGLTPETVRRLKDELDEQIRGSDDRRGTDE